MNDSIKDDDMSPDNHTEALGHVARCGFRTMGRLGGITADAITDALEEATSTAKRLTTAKGPMDILGVTLDACQTAALNSGRYMVQVGSTGMQFLKDVTTFQASEPGMGEAYDSSVAARSSADDKYRS